MASASGLSTKVNVNLGISGDMADEAEEVEEGRRALGLGADAIMDLSNIGKTRRVPPRAHREVAGYDRHRAPCTTPSATWKSRWSSSPRTDLLDVVRAHAEDGVDFVTIHAA